MTESQETAEEKKIKELIERYATGDSLSEKVRNLLTAQGGLTHIPPYQLAVVEVVNAHEILIQKENMERAKKLRDSADILDMRRATLEEEHEKSHSQAVWLRAKADELEGEGK